jgi:hypothetical protein
MTHKVFSKTEYDALTLQEKESYEPFADLLEIRMKAWQYEELKKRAEENNPNAVVFQIFRKPDSKKIPKEK